MEGSDSVWRSWIPVRRGVEGREVTDSWVSLFFGQEDARLEFAKLFPESLRGGPDRERKALSRAERELRDSPCYSIGESTLSFEPPRVVLRARRLVGLDRPTPREQQSATSKQAISDVTVEHVH